MTDAALAEDGAAQVSAAISAFRPGSASREDGFTVRDLAGAGVVCTDGTYLYAKRWYNDASTVYPGTDFFTRVGTGYGGSERGRNYGTFGDSTTAGISATYHGDGYIYAECGRVYQLERLDVTTGRLDTVAVPDGLLEWKRGRVEDGHALITSDGRYVYNVSMSSPRGTRTEWGVRVFEPGDGWRLVRQFTSPPTETAFTFEWTDGLLADGRHLYFLEYGGQRRIRMVDAVDGRFLDEWRSDQDTTRVISGQYDGRNNKVWLGDLLGSGLYRYGGVGRSGRAAVIAPAVGPAARWDRVLVSGDAGQGDLRLALQGERGDGAWSDLPGLADLPLGRAVDLSGVDADAYPRLRLQARLADTTGTARLASWSLAFRPRPDLQLAGARATAAGDSGVMYLHLAVRNRTPAPVAGATLRLELDDGALVGRRSLPALARGATLVAADTVALPPLGRRLFAAVDPGEADAEPRDNRLEVPLLFEGRAPVAVVRWPSGQPLASGDPLRPDEGLLVSAPPVAAPRLALALDGARAEADSVLPAAVGYGLRLLLRPQLPAGEHRLQAHLFSGTVEIGGAERVFHVSDELLATNLLVYPHPVRQAADFTFALSEAAEVTVEIYALSGRLVRRLGPEPREAGFGRLAWDGRDEGGQPVAGGTYLYRFEARGPDRRQFARRRPLVVVR
ncbi:MAG: FlgD immunoglobulin-like domain containing protein [Gemmatimonadota bacterium]